MNEGLATLRALRCRAEEETEKTLRVAADARALTDEKQRLADGQVEAARDRLAAARRPPGGASPRNAGEAVGRETFLRRLGGELVRAEEAARVHRDGPLAEAIRAEKKARHTHAQARSERQALDKLVARREAEARQLADRRHEDAASDRAQAAHGRLRKDP